MQQQAIDPVTLAALISAQQKPAYQMAGEPVYRGVSTSGQVGGIASNGTPMALPAGATPPAAPVNYGQMFAGIASAVQQGASEWGKAKMAEGQAQGLMDSNVAPEIPEGFQPAAPNFRPVILQFQQPGAVARAVS